MFMYTDLYMHTYKDTIFKVNITDTTALEPVAPPCLLSTLNAFHICCF